MSLINSFETSLLQLIFLNTALGDLGSIAGLQPASAAGTIYISLHTADPTEAAASQSVSEMTYTGYARSGALRDGTGWVVTGNVADNFAAEQMGENTGSSETSTHFMLGFASSGATTAYMIGTASLVVSVGVDPEFAAGALDVSLD